MSDKETLRDFLVKLSFDVQEDQLNKFTDAIFKGSLQAKLFGDAIEGVARKVVDNLGAITSKFEGLYYSSQRTGASVANIKALEYAFSQMGSSASEASGTLESFTKWARENPGFGAPLKALGVDTIDKATGKARDYVEILMDVGQALNKLVQEKGTLGYAEAIQWGKLLGIDENSLRILMNPGELRKKFAEQNSIFAKMGLNPNEIAKKSAEIENSFRRFGAILEGIALKIADQFAKTGLDKKLAQIGDYFIQNGDQIASKVERFTNGLIDAIKYVAEFAGKIIDVLGPETAAGLVVAGLVTKFTGIGTVISTFVIPMVFALGKALAGLAMGASGLALRALAALLIPISAGGAAAALLGGAVLATAYPTATGEEKPEDRARNLAKDPHYYEPGHPGGQKNQREGQQLNGGAEDQRNLWQKTKDFFGKFVGIEPSKASETVEGQPGGETNGVPATIGNELPGNILRPPDPNKNDYAQTARIKGITADQRGLLDALTGPEGRGVYNLWIGGYRFGSYSQHPGTGPRGSDAGRYQFTKSTWDDINKSLHLPNFSPENQDKAALFLAAQNYRARSGRDLWQDMKSGNFDPKYLENRWVSIDEQHVGKKRWMREHFNPAMKRAYEYERATQKFGGSTSGDKWENRPQFDYSNPSHPLIKSGDAAEKTAESIDKATKAATNFRNVIMNRGINSTPVGASHSNITNANDNSRAQTNNVNQTINISGTFDPKDAQRQFEIAGSRVSANLLRNLQGAAQ